MRIDPETGRLQPFELHCGTCGLLDGDLEGPEATSDDLVKHEVLEVGADDPRPEDLLHIPCGFNETWVHDPQEV